MYKRGISFMLVFVFIFMFIANVMPNVALATNDDPDTQNEKEVSESYSKLINNKQGNTFVKIIATTIVSICASFQWVLKQFTPFKTLDGLVFNADDGLESSLQGNAKYRLLPLSQSQWDIMKKIFNAIAYVMLGLLIIPVVLVAIKFIRAGINSKLREEAYADLLRVITSSLIILLVPIAFPLLLAMNNWLVQSLTYFNVGGRTLNETLSISGVLTGAIDIESAIGAAMVIAVFTYLELRLTLLFMIRLFTIMVYFAFTPIMAFMWSLDKSINAASIWVGELLSNVFMQFFYAFLLILYLLILGATGVDGKPTHWFVTLTWGVLILQLGDVLRNSVQGALARMSGLDESRASLGGIGMLAGVVAGGKALVGGASNITKTLTSHTVDSGMEELGGSRGGSFGSSPSGSSIGSSDGSFSDGVESINLGSDYGQSGVFSDYAGSGGVASMRGGVVGSAYSESATAQVGELTEGPGQGGVPFSGSMGGIGVSGGVLVPMGGPVGRGGVIGGIHGHGISPEGDSAGEQFALPGINTITAGPIGGSGVSYPSPGGIDGVYTAATDPGISGEMVSGGEVVTAAPNKMEPSSETRSVIGDVVSPGEDGAIDVDYTVLPDELPAEPGVRDHINYRLSRNHNIASGIGRAAEVGARIISAPMAAFSGEKGVELSQDIGAAVGSTVKAAASVGINTGTIIRQAKESGKTIRQTVRDMSGVHYSSDPGKRERFLKTAQAFGRMGAMSFSGSEKAAERMREYGILDRYRRPQIDGMRYK